jgi:ABC-type lipoprotein export system ATPase subunit
MPRGVSVRLEEVTRSFDGGLVRALRGVSLDVAAGESVAVMGPTGCGKSTLLSVIGLLDEPDSGRVFLEGRPAAEIGRAEDFRAERLGFVFQFHHLLPHLTVAENVALPLEGRAGRAEAAARAEDVLSRVGLGGRARTLAVRLSGGERQLAALARALVGKPDLLLADEPTGSVDSETGGRILALLEEWSAATSGTLILVTHDPSVAARCRRLVTMRDGAVVQDGAPVRSA